MSDSNIKEQRSKRLHKETTHIQKQLKIAKSRGDTETDKLALEPHRLSKHHAMDCGNPGCALCGNPRRNAWFKKERLTAQERRLFQDLEAHRDKRSNGLDNE
mgnify:CR=1 FL=1